MLRQALRRQKKTIRKVTRKKLDDIYDAPVVLDSSSNVKTRAPKAAEKATKPKKNNRKVTRKK